jgi:hypothetical protein
MVGGVVAGGGILIRRKIEGIDLGSDLAQELVLALLHSLAGHGFEVVLAIQVEQA